ncbi:MAG: hypothetical protein M1281_03600 [Chloroflexi bacterium]|nr:hypothetical protein [Chloroflexota bacterium]
MNTKSPRNIKPVSGGFFSDLALRIKLILRLLGDKRVNPLLKLLPIGALAYWLIPDLAPGPIDDAAIIWLGAYLFVELCPQEVVKEHMDRLQNVVTAQWHEAHSDGEIIDGEVRDVGDDRDEPKEEQ